LTSIWFCDIISEKSDFHESEVLNLTAVSVTITLGTGSEPHNHSTEFRQTLSHVHSMEDGIIEVIPYNDYADTIDAIVLPYLKEYDERLQQKYQIALEKYNAGQTRHKPQLTDYRSKGESYIKYRQSLRKVLTPLFRSIIVGIGDQSDRETGRVTAKQAIAIFTEFISDFQKRFPLLILLGATIHLDEIGFFHMHIDFFPMYQKENHKQGLSVGFGLEKTLQMMGLTPELSIINATRKKPLVFNAFRNTLYLSMESAMSKQGLRLQYAVTQMREPEKAASKHQDLESWRAVQDKARQLQLCKNMALDILEHDMVSPDGLKSSLIAVDKITHSLKYLEASPQTLLKNGYKVSVEVYQQLKEATQEFSMTVGHLLKKIDTLTEEANHYYSYKEKYEKAEKELKQLKPTHSTMADYMSLINQEREAKEMQQKVKNMEQFMCSIQTDSGKNLLDIYLEQDNRYENRRKQEKSRI